MKFAIPKLYTELAAYYDSIESRYRNYDLELKCLETILTQKHVRRVVDISCGSTSHVAGIAAQSTISELLAMDVSKEMLDVGKSSQDSRGYPSM